MNSVPENLQLRMIRGKPALREIENSYSVTWRGHVYTVPTGYRFDGSSIPRLLWPWFGAPFGYGNAQAGALHDAAYDGELLQDGLIYWMPPMQSHALWRFIRTTLFQCGAGRIKRTRYLIQGWLAWLALVVYYVVRGRKQYVSIETWRKKRGII